MIGVDTDMDYLYDPQAAKPIGFCPRCGGELYGPGPCPSCERRNDDNKIEGENL